MRESSELSSLCDRSTFISTPCTTSLPTSCLDCCDNRFQTLIHSCPQYHSIAKDAASIHVYTTSSSESDGDKGACRMTQTSHLSAPVDVPSKTASPSDLKQSVSEPTNPILMSPTFFHDEKRSTNIVITPRTEVQGFGLNVGCS